MHVGTVMLPEIEPVFNSASCSVLLDVGGMPGRVAWPGPNVVANPAAIHGLYEAPLPNQKVLVGYAENSLDSPVVIGKYSYPISYQDATKALTVLPITSRSHFASDVILGSFTASYIALRSVSLPGQIDLFSPTLISLQGMAGITGTSPAYFSMTAGSTTSITAGTTATISAGTTAAFSAGTAATITSGTTMGLTATGALSASATTITLTSSVGGATQPAVKGTTLNSNLSSLLSILQTFFNTASGDPLAVVVAGAAGVAAAALPAVTGSIATHLSTGVFHS